MTHYSHEDDFLTSLLSIWIDVTYVTQALNSLSPKGDHIDKSNCLAFNRIKGLSGSIET